MKNKIAPPFKTAEFDIMFGSGIDYEWEIIDLCVAQGIVEKAGSWISYGDEKLGQGKEGAREFLKANKEVAEKIKKEIFKKIEEDKAS